MATPIDSEPTRAPMRVRTPFDILRRVELRSSAMRPLARSERRALGAVVCVTALLHVVGIWWGLPALPHSWAADEFSPFTVHDGLQRWFSNGWFELYPPFHIYVLAVALAPVEILAGTGVVDFRSPVVYTTAYYMIRLVSVVMAAGVVLVMFQLTRELLDVRAGLFAALAAGLMAPFVYYAKLANVEVPYLLWLALSLLFFVRVLARHRMTDYLGFAATAALAIATKDQAYGFYLFIPFVVAASDARRRRDAGVPAPYWRSVINARMLAALGVGTLVLVLAHNLLFNWSGALERIRIMTGPITRDLQEFPDTLAGHAGMMLLGARHLQFALGWPLFLAALAGLGLAVLRRRQHTRVLALLLPIASYWIFLIVPIMYHYDRYLLGVSLILCVFAGYGLSTLTRLRGRARWAGGILAAATVGYSVLYAASVDVLMTADARYAAERWIRENVAARQRVMAIGYEAYLPRLRGVEVVTSVRPTLDELAAVAPDYVVTTSAFEDWRFRDEPASQAFLHDLRAGRTPYEFVFGYRARPALNLLRLDGVRTNLDKINPRIRIYRRRTE